MVFVYAAADRWDSCVRAAQATVGKNIYISGFALTF